MQLTIDSNEPLERVLDVVGSLYGVRLAVSSETPAAPVAAGSPLAPPGSPEGPSEPGPAARLFPLGPTAAGPPPPTSPPDTATIRQWAQANGVAVKDRGRIPASVVAAYHQRDRAAE